MVILVKLLRSVSQDVTLNITNNVHSHSLFCLQRSVFDGFFTPPFLFRRFTDGLWLVSVLRGAGGVAPSLLYTPSPGLARSYCPSPQDPFGVSHFSKPISV